MKCLQGGGGSVFNRILKLSICSVLTTCMCSKSVTKILTIFALVVTEREHGTLLATMGSPFEHQL